MSGFATSQALPSRVFRGYHGTAMETYRQGAMNDVYLLWYIREVDGADDELLIGVYRGEADARAAIGRLRSKPGFSTFPDGFQVRPYELNQDHWIDGFVVDTT